jgi:hypothetical protein
MKKLMFVLLAAATMMMTACSKENKLNKKLEGTWSLVSRTEGGITATAEAMGMTYTMTFTKVEKDAGTYVSVTTYTGFPSYTSTGAYTLHEDTQMTSTQSTPTTGSADVLIVNSYSKTDMTVTDTEGVVLVLKKN